MNRERPEAAAKGQPGSQTLARGLSALIAVVDSQRGLTTLEAAEILGVHRSIAYRLLQTLVDFGFLARTDDAIYRPGARLAAFADAFLPGLRETALPAMRHSAEQLRSTIAMFVAEGNEAVALAIVEPTNAAHHIAFRAGMRTPLDRGAAAYALGTGLPQQPDEPEGTTRARERGFAVSCGEIVPGAFGVSALVPLSSSATRLCIQLITFEQEQAEGSGPALVAAAADIGTKLDEHLASASNRLRVP